MTKMNINEVSTMTLDQTRRAVIVAIMADVSAMVWGSYGVGKSSMLQQIAKSMKRKLFDYRVSDKQPSDTGVPVPDKETKIIDIYVPNILPFERVLEHYHGGKDTPAILLLDELDRPSDEGMQGVSLQLLLDRSANGEPLGKNVAVVAAGNGVTDTGTLEFTDAQRSRLVHFYVDDSNPDGLQNYLNYAEGVGISPALRSFARFRNEVWAVKSPEFVDEARMSKRSWDNVDKLMQAMKIAHDELGMQVDDIRFPLIAGSVGQEAGAKYSAWMNAYDKMPDPATIVSDPEGAIVPEEADVVHITAQTVIDMIDPDDREKNTALVTYAMRLEDEMTEFVLTEMIRKDDKVATLPDVIVWMNAHGND